MYCVFAVEQADVGLMPPEMLDMSELMDWAHSITSKPTPQQPKHTNSIQAGSHLASLTLIPASSMLDMSPPPTPHRLLIEHHGAHPTLPRAPSMQHIPLPSDMQSTPPPAILLPPTTLPSSSSLQSIPPLVASLPPSSSMQNIARPAGPLPPSSSMPSIARPAGRLPPSSSMQSIARPAGPLPPSSSMQNIARPAGPLPPSSSMQNIARPASPLPPSSSMQSIARPASPLPPSSSMPSIARPAGPLPPSSSMQSIARHAGPLPPSSSMQSIARPAGPLPPSSSMQSIARPASPLPPSSSMQSIARPASPLPASMRRMLPPPTPPSILIDQSSSVQDIPPPPIPPRFLTDMASKPEVIDSQQTFVLSPDVCAVLNQPGMTQLLAKAVKACQELPASERGRGRIREPGGSQAGPSSYSPVTPTHSNRTDRYISTESRWKAQIEDVVSHVITSVTMPPSQEALEAIQIGVIDTLIHGLQDETQQEKPGSQPAVKLSNTLRQSHANPAQSNSDQALSGGVKRSRPQVSDTESDSQPTTLVKDSLHCLRDVLQSSGGTQMLSPWKSVTTQQIGFAEQENRLDTSHPSDTESVHSGVLRRKHVGVIQELFNHATEPDWDGHGIVITEEDIQTTQGEDRAKVEFVKILLEGRKKHKQQESRSKVKDHQHLKKHKRKKMRRHSLDKQEKSECEDESEEADTPSVNGYTYEVMEMEKAESEMDEESDTGTCLWRHNDSDTIKSAFGVKSDADKQTPTPDSECRMSPENKQASTSESHLWVSPENREMLTHPMSLEAGVTKSLIPRVVVMQGGKKVASSRKVIPTSPSRYQTSQNQCGITSDSQHQMAQSEIYYCITFVIV